MECLGPILRGSPTSYKPPILLPRFMYGPTLLVYRLLKGTADDGEISCNPQIAAGRSFKVYAKLAVQLVACFCTGGDKFVKL